MADEKKEEGAEEAAPPPARNTKKMVIAGVAVLVLLLAIGVPVTFMAMKPKKVSTEELSADAAHGEDGHAEGHNDEDEVEEGEEVLGAIFPLETFVVNLEGGRYIRAQIQVEFSERDVPKRFLTKLVPIRDSIITMLSGRTQDDVASVKGKESLKNDIKSAVNEALRKEEVKNVYFTQFIVQ